MPTDIKLILEFSHVSTNMCVTLQDREQLIAEISKVDDLVVELNFKFSIPNQLLFHIKQLGSEAASVALKKITLGGLDLTPNILDQICNYTPVNLDKSIVTTMWQQGKANIDFFAADWIQYHLLYGNKIILNK
jgi:hypothetical protein